MGGAVEIDNLGVAVTAGVKVAGHFGLTDGVSFSGSPIFSAMPLTPSVVASGTVGTEVGGQVIVGPGAGTTNAGVIAGVGGELNPVDASFGPVTYTATLIPTGSTLHVRYIFASEEYPEYVGSALNDVMAVYVNGVNCATVPGTNDPVSVNTINASENSAYFVDNSAGASGLATTMDGLTSPLECKAPVTIGKPVTVKIAVADASDRVFDSAVALLDQGIWSD